MSPPTPSPENFCLWSWLPFPILTNVYSYTSARSEWNILFKKANEISIYSQIQRQREIVGLSLKLYLDPNKKLEIDPNRGKQNGENKKIFLIAKIVAKLSCLYQNPQRKQVCIKWRLLLSVDWKLNRVSCWKNVDNIESAHYTAERIQEKVTIILPKTSSRISLYLKS